MGLGENRGGGREMQGGKGGEGGVERDDLTCRGDQGGRRK